MRIHRDKAVAEVRIARKALCDRFGNDPRRSRTWMSSFKSGLRQRSLSVVPFPNRKDGSSLPERRVELIAMLRYGINDIRLFYENDVRFLKQF